MLQGPAWVTAQRQGSPENAQGVEHRRNEEEEWEARQEGQGLRQELRLVLGDQQGPSPPHLTSPACLANIDLWDCWWGQQWRWQQDQGEWERWERGNGDLSHQIAAGYQGCSEDSILSLWVFQTFTLCQSDPFPSANLCSQRNNDWRDMS